jgi:hypothetical protein
MVATNLYQHVDGMDGGIQSKVFQSLIAISPPQGALNQLWCGEIPVDEARKLSGSFVSCFQTAIPYRPDLGNSAAVDKLWDWCAAQANKTK